jgi:hypothetical protein
MFKNPKKFERAAMAVLAVILGLSLILPYIAL